MGMPIWTIVPDDSDICSREKLLERLKIADKIIHAYVAYLGPVQMIEALHESDLVDSNDK